MSNYIDKLKHINDQSIKAQLAVIKYQVKILGTDVVIERYDQESEHRAAFGSMFQTDDFTRVKKDFTTSRYVINRNYLTDHYSKQSQPLQVYHWEPELQVGDVISFRQSNIEYKLKVERKYSYGLAPHILYKYDLIGIPESTEDSDGAGDSC